MIARVTCLLAAVMVLPAGAASAAESKYTIEDLEALVKNRSWSELVQHLEDVPPAKRAKRWQRVALAAARGYLTSTGDQRNPIRGLLAADGLTRRYAFLRGHKSFMKERARVGMKGFEACFGRRYGVSHCAERLLPFVEADKGNADLALAAARLIMRNQFAYFGVSYYRLAAQWGKGQKKYCTAKRLQESVMAALALPPRNVLVGRARQLAAACWTHLKQPLLEGVGSGGSYYRKNTCPLLRSKKALSGLRAKKCKGIP